MSASEHTPLRPHSNSAGGEGKNFYFLKNKVPSSANIDRDYHTRGTAEEKMEISQGGLRSRDNSMDRHDMDSRHGWNWFNPFSWEKRSGYQKVRSPVMQKPRKVPVKVEPKVFFANERTFLAWLHMSVTLASISMAIVAFADANDWSQLYGLLLMPVSIAFCGYSLWLYMRRAAMIRRRDPGPYEDRAGPIILSVLLGVSIVVNFFLKLYDLS
mmetsp:Transcript_8813/g.13190  ORF Transcript_8813/g.13190 Transcript_8813/m.13190 type:complete len:213 (+) Transcript_8813:72-710(+)|eukprot:CAMPEP_0185018226 /NCGR_PEP_ID=MMETSP1103-20130426/1021_1 /TAXON_ID=36769 /ORGANISM="Paraphysomonas bandaiensis, Strain Caron Lab Isolate" /LENGTH=212 /DNA_ID=CAMNT_0027547965 /DNA_START=61 /DNA_END=699 /DNA_ORIENTATION=+